MGGERDRVAQLREDYESIALTGTKRWGDAGTGAHQEALGRLADAGLAAREGEAIALLRPEHARVELDADTRAQLLSMHALWRRADDYDSEDEVLYGELGFWQHLWNALPADGTPEDRVPLQMDVAVADGPAFTGRDWLREFDPSIVDYVFAGPRLRGRMIVPPATLGAPAESLVEAAIGFGLQVRVFPTPSQYLIFDDRAAVLPDEHGSGEPERHRLTRRPGIVDPLRRLFLLQWSAAIPWGDFKKGTAGILRMLAQGWTDARVADAMGVSSRTISRRVTEAMQAAGVQSRFELGMRYALSELERTAD